DRGPAGAHGPRLRLPAGGRPARAVQGRRLRVRADLRRSRPGAAPDRPGAARGPRHPLADLRDRAQRRAGGGLRAAAAHARGRAVLSDELPYVTGSIGLLGTKPTDDMIENCDTLLMIGSSFPYSEWLPKPGQARGVQIDIDARVIGLRYPMEVNLVGGAAGTL